MTPIDARAPPVRDKLENFLCDQGLAITVLIAVLLPAIMAALNKPIIDLKTYLAVALAALLLGAIKYICRLPDNFVEPILWALLTSGAAATSIVATRFAQELPMSSLAWALALAVFAVLSAVLALTMQTRTLAVREASASAILTVAATVAATIATPLGYVRTDLWVYAIATFVGTAITVLLLFLNERSFDKRRTILQSFLDGLFQYDPQTEQKNFAILKIAAQKYGAVLNGPTSMPLRHKAVVGPAESRWPLIMSASAYLAFCVFGYIVLLAPLCVVFEAAPACKPSWIGNALLWTSKYDLEAADLIATVSIAGAAFLGAHVFTLRYLFKAALNSELNQFKWIRGGLHLFTAIVVSVILYRTFRDTAYLSTLLNATTPALWLGLAFVAGWIPDFAIISIFRRLRVSQLKSVDEETLKSASVVPIELIDGIDYDTRYRLEENNIVDMQSLATYNPVLLYVETPFGLEQIFDWILQAQLCLLAGPKPFVELKKLAIRSIKQLETIVKSEPSPGYLQMIGQAIYLTTTAERLAPIGKPARPATDTAAAVPAGLDERAIVATLQASFDDPHLVELNKLRDYIYGRLPA